MLKETKQFKRVTFDISHKLHQDMKVLCAITNKTLKKIMTECLEGKIKEYNLYKENTHENTD